MTSPSRRPFLLTAPTFGLIAGLLGASSLQAVNEPLQPPAGVEGSEPDPQLEAPAVEAPPPARRALEPAQRAEGAEPMAVLVLEAPALVPVVQEQVFEVAPGPAWNGMPLLPPPLTLVQQADLAANDAEADALQARAEAEDRADLDEAAGAVALTAAGLRALAENPVLQEDPDQGRLLFGLAQTAHFEAKQAFALAWRHAD